MQFVLFYFNSNPFWSSGIVFGGLLIVFQCQFVTRGWVFLCLCSCCEQLSFRNLFSCFVPPMPSGCLWIRPCVLWWFMPTTTQFHFCWVIGDFCDYFKGFSWSDVFQCIANENLSFFWNFPSSDIDVCQNFNRASCLVRKVYNYKVGYSDDCWNLSQCLHSVFPTLRLLNFTLMRWE